MTPYTPGGTAEPRPARLTVPALAAMARDGPKIAMLTAYDASFAALAERAGIDVLLIGDSLGMVIQGHDSTLPVTLDDVLYHTRCVAAGCARPLVIADLPFGSYQASHDQAYAASAAALQGRRADGQARRRRLARAHRRVPRDARRAGVRPRRLAAAIGQRTRRLSRAGQDRGRRRDAAGRRERAGRRGRVAAGRRMRAASTGRGADARCPAFR